ncbi:MAG: glutamate--cysteine ligase, partial [Myxococcales bacterium]|nr:glutamate--cysteine ligase [Myxococcales bacterium]
IMREYLPTRGGRALDMMQRTATVQANFDYASEEDAGRKLRVSLAISPVVAAMFANSPFVEGRPTGERSHRAGVWLDVDPDRAGLLPFAWGDGPFRYQDYVEWALDVPMFGFKRGGELVANTGQTFRSFLEDGHRGHVATQTDWRTHLNTLFPEVRLKNTLEIRSADSQTTARICALPALLKGVLYEDDALSAAESLVSGLDHDAVLAARPDVAAKGLRGMLGGREIGEWAAELVAIAEGGLERLSHLDRKGQDERVHLASLRRLLDRGLTPADALIEAYDPDKPLLDQLLENENARL